MLTKEQKLKLFYRLDSACLAITLARTDTTYPDSKLMDQTVDATTRTQAEILYAVVEEIFKEHLVTSKIAKTPAEIVDLFKGGNNEA